MNRKALGHRLCLMFSLLLAFSAPVPLQAAGQASAPDLPETAAARAAIEQDPSVVRARHALAAAAQAEQRLIASPYEWTARVGVQRRAVDAGGSSGEWSAQLERPLRVGGKAEIDRELGASGLRLARAQLGEARHEAARALAELWLDALAAMQAHALAREQVEFAAANSRAAEVRRRAGDASQLDLNVALADLGETQRRLNLALSQESKALTRLRMRFPPLPAPQPAQAAAQALSDPQPLDRDEAHWRERILAESEALRAAQEALRRAQLSADRVRAERVSDPSVGVYTASEARRSERIVGLSLSIAIGGAYREAGLREALQQTEMARADSQSKRREIELSVAESVAEARGSQQRWLLAQESARGARELARLSQRAYTLGEGDLQSLLLVRRQALDAVGAADTARAEALRARHRLLIDAHLIWDLAED